MKRTLTCILSLFCIFQFLSAQWIQQPTGTIRPFYALDFISATQGFAGSTGQLYYTNNGGSTWTDVRASGVDSMILAGNRYHDVHFESISNGWGVGWNVWSNVAVIYQTTTAGNSWTLQYSGGSCAILGDCYFNAIDFASSQVGVAVGTEGLIVRTTNGGGSWNVVASGLTDELFDIQFADANTGYISGEGIILKTVNGGANWTTVGNVSQNCYALDFIHPDTGMVAAGQGRVFVTHSGGASWREYQTLDQNDLYGITLINADTAYACGEDYVYKTASGGTHWQTQLSSGSGFHRDIAFPATGQGVAVGDSGSVILTQTGGDPLTYSDAGAIDFLTPDPNSCPIDVPLKVQIRNFGFDTLFSADIQWADNGTSQPAYAWTGALAPGEFSDTLCIDTVTWNRDPHAIQLWTASPNATADEDLTNDTLTFSYTPLIMQGTYTIGGTNPDYVNISDFINDLHARGVCGHVIGDIRPGTYVEYLDFITIPFVDQDNYVTIRAENGVTGSVILDRTNAPHILEMEDTRYVNFEHLAFQATSTHSSGGIVVELVGCEYLRFSDCIFQCPTVLPHQPMVRYAISPSSTAYGHIVWERNEFREGARGIELSGGFSGNPFFEDMTIKNNVFLDLKTSGIYCARGKELRVEGNEIQMEPGYYSTGILITDVDSFISVRHNKVVSDSGRAMLFTRCRGDSVHRSIISDNFFSARKSIAQHSVGFTSSFNVDFVHNSVYVETIDMFVANGAMSIGRPSFSSAHPMRDNRILNNLFVNNGGNYAIRATTSNATELRTFAEMDHNCFYVINDPQPNSLFWLSGLQAPLTQWTDLFQKDSNSVIMDPQFLAWDDLHIQNTQLNGLAPYLPGYTFDIDSTQRDSLNREMGADELNLSLQLIHQQDPLCAGNSDGVIEVQGLSGTSPYSYFWPHNNSTDSTLSGLTAGAYQVIVTDGSGNQDTLNMVLTDPPPLTASSSPICDSVNCQHALAVTASGGTPGYTYTWPHDGTTGAIATNLCDSVYTINIVDANNCPLTHVDTLACGSVNRDPFRDQLEIQVYPNPATDHLFIELFGSFGEPVQLRLISMQGQVLKEGSHPGQRLEWNLDQIPSGSYYLEARHTHQRWGQIVTLQK